MRDYTQNEKVIETFEKLDLGNEGQLFGKAMFHKDRGTRGRSWEEFSKAIELLQICIRKNKDDVRYHANLGYCFYMSRKISQAIKCYGKVIELDDEHFNGLYGLGLCYWKLRETKKAYFWFEKALLARPGHEEAQRMFLVSARVLGKERDQKRFINTAQTFLHWILVEHPAKYKILDFIRDKKEVGAYGVSYAEVVDFWEMDREHKNVKTYVTKHLAWLLKQNLIIKMPNSDPSRRGKWLYFFNKEWSPELSEFLEPNLV